MHIRRNGVFIEDAFRLYTYFQEDTTRFILFFVCCVLVCIAAVILKKRGDTVFTQVRNKLVLPSLLLAVLLFNPFSASLLVSKMAASRVFRFSWVVPLLVVVAITMVAVVRKLPFKPVKVLAAVLAPLLFIGVNFQLSSFLDKYALLPDSRRASYLGAMLSPADKALEGHRRLCDCRSAAYRIRSFHLPIIMSIARELF